MVNLMRPDQPMLTLREAMDRLFEQSFTPFARNFLGENGYQQWPANLWEDQNHYYVYLVLPGVDPASVEITATEGVVTIAGQVTPPSPEGAKAVWQEWGPTTFRRQFQLPSGFDAEHCQATYRDGVLSLIVPKPEQTKPKSIRIQPAEGKALAGEKSRK